MRKFYYSRQSEWLDKAYAMKPELNKVVVEPVSAVRTEAEQDIWQGVAVARPQSMEIALGEWYHWPREWCFDFGRHIVGTVEITIEAAEFNDSPLRLDYKFAETPYELATNFSTYHGHLDRSWLQDGVFIEDELPPAGTPYVITLPRRFAFRYLKFRIGAPNYDIRILSVKAIAESSADDGAYQPPAQGRLTPLEEEVERRSAWTLHECMQCMFEDGPKRDRRLWLGDLRIQALENAVTFKNFKLTERCLYILAGLADGETGELYGAAFERADGLWPSCRVQTYALLFGPMLYEHWLFTHNDAICRELFEVALRQIEIVRQHVTEDGRLETPGKGWWLFVDHDAGLERETPALGILLFSMQRLASLGKAIGMPHPELLEDAAELKAKINSRCYDSAEGMYRSDGPTRQLSWATQAWMLLAEVPETEEKAVSIWKKMLSSATARRPRTPYLWSTVLEAGWQLGRKDDARSIIASYWGEMARHPGDTFPEMFVPEDPYYSSYGDCLMNSDCHAWSCGAGYFLRLL